MNRVAAFAEQCMPTEPPVYRVTDVPFEKWIDEGVRGLVLDNEGTMAETGSDLLVPEYIGRIIEAREAGIEYVAIATNKMVTTRRDRRMLSAWGEQLDADLVLMPLTPDQAKPSPIMNYKFMERFGLNPDEVGVVGDKATADIRGAYFARVEHRAWTRPFGGNQHVGDKLIRGPFEAALRVHAHLQLNPIIDELAVQESESGVNMAEILSLVAEEIRPGTVPDGQDKIVGYGVADVELSEEVLASIKRPAFRVVLEQIKEFADRHGEIPAEWLKNFLYEHGRTVADACTWGRLGLAFGIAYVANKDLDPSTKQKLSGAIMVAGLALDGFDGPAARAHKNGATVQGGKDDQNIDKVLTATEDILILLPGGLTSLTDVLLSNGRDLAITGLRRPFLQRGIDTKSIMSGKVAMGDKAFAQTTGAFVGDRHHLFSKKLQRSATILKLGSMAHAPFAWVEQHERKQHEANNLEKLIKLSS